MSFISSAVASLHKELTNLFKELSSKVHPYAGLETVNQAVLEMDFSPLIGVSGSIPKNLRNWGGNDGEVLPPPFFPGEIRKTFIPLVNRVPF